MVGHMYPCLLGFVDMMSQKCHQHLMLSHHLTDVLSVLFRSCTQIYLSRWTWCGKKVWYELHTIVYYDGTKNTVQYHPNFQERYCNESCSYLWHGAGPSLFTVSDIYHIEEPVFLLFLCGRLQVVGSKEYQFSIRWKQLQASLVLFKELWFLQDFSLNKNICTP